MQIRKLLVVMFALLLPGAAAAQGYAIEAIHLSGDPSPATGEFYDEFNSYDVADDGEIAFVSDSVANVRLVVRHDSGVDSLVAIEGDAAPGTGGQTFTDLLLVRGNGLGPIVFLADYTPGPSDVGVFADGAFLEDVALTGDAVPGGGTVNFPLSVVLDDAGTAVFATLVSGGASGLYEAPTGPAGAIAKVVASGDVAPDTGGGTFVTPAFHDVSGPGVVVFFSAVAGGSTSEGIFLEDSGALKAIALVGDPAPGGGTFTDLSRPGISDAGVVGFQGIAAGAMGVYAGPPGLIARIAGAGDAAPGGGTYTSASSFDINAAGDIVYKASVSGGSIGVGLFAERGGIGELVAAVGDAAPGTSGGTLLGFSQPRIGASGEIVFAASVSGGSTTRGLFRATPQTAMVPALSLAHALALVVLMLSAGKAALGRRRVRSPRSS